MSGRYIHPTNHPPTDVWLFSAAKLAPLAHLVLNIECAAYCTVINMCTHSGQTCTDLLVKLSCTGSCRSKLAGANACWAGLNIQYAAHSY
jgi:hypothetical protein